MRRLCQIYGGILQRKLRCGIYLQRTKLRCRIYLHQTCTNSNALQNYLQRTCTNSRHVAEIFYNVNCVAEIICNGRAQTVIALQTFLIFFLKTAAVSSDSQYIYNQLEMRSKLRTRQIYIYNKYTYTQGCLSASDGPSSENGKKIHTYTTNVHILKAASQRQRAQAPNCWSRRCRHPIYT